MPDKETVITHLQIISTWASFARERDLQFFTARHLEDMAQWADDTIILLKAQPEIIRCKDCMHFDGCDCKVNDIVNIMDTEWFCADGERR